MLHTFLYRLIPQTCVDHAYIKEAKNWSINLHIWLKYHFWRWKRHLNRNIDPYFNCVPENEGDHSLVLTSVVKLVSFPLLVFAKIHVSGSFGEGLEGEVCQIYPSSWWSLSHNYLSPRTFNFISPFSSDCITQNSFYDSLSLNQIIQ